MRKLWVVLAAVCALVTGAVSRSYASPQCFFPLLSECSNATLYGPVNPESARQVITTIQAANRSFSKAPIFLYIDSPGGSVGAGGAIITAMEASRRPVYTVDVGMAASMAALIEIHGVKRYMLPRTLLMFHNASFSAEGEAPQVAQQSALVGRIIDTYVHKICDLTGLSRDQVRLHMADQWWLLPDEAIANHLIDEMVNVADYPAP